MAMFIMGNGKTIVEMGGGFMKIDSLGISMQETGRKTREMALVRN